MADLILPSTTAQSQMGDRGVDIYQRLLK